MVRLLTLEIVIKLLLLILLAHASPFGTLAPIATQQKGAL
jgi:hypothetical protein